jgi:uncharacterized membrane protein YgaE (UPF0421/DUF939 family)
MEDLAKMVSIIFASSIVIGGVAGNRIAKHYGKSQTIGTLIGVGIGFVGLVAVVRIKGALDMKKMQEEQQNQNQTITNQPINN